MQFCTRKRYANVSDRLIIFKGGKILQIKQLKTMSLQKSDKKCDSLYKKKTNKTCTVALNSDV